MHLIAQVSGGFVRDLLAVGLGLISGLLSGAFGVGGAVVSTPGVRALGDSALLAVGTTLPPVVLSAIVGSVRYAKEQLVDWRVVAATAPAGMVAAVLGSLASHAVPGGGHWLMISTAALLAFTAVRMARPKRTQAPGQKTPLLPKGGNYWWAAAAGVGGVAGLLSGLLGVGGGLALVPGFCQVLRLPLKTAIATSLACVGVLAVPSTLTHAILGDIDWRLAVILMLSVLPGARLGASAAIRSTDRRLRVVVAFTLMAVAVIYGAGEVAAL